MWRSVLQWYQGKVFPMWLVMCVKWMSAHQSIQSHSLWFLWDTYKKKCNIIEMWMRRRVRQRKTDPQCWNRDGTHIVECPRDLIVSVYISCLAEKTTIFWVFFFNCKWKYIFFSLWISIVDKILMSCFQVVAVSWKPLAILFVRGWNCLREKKEER